MLSIILALIGLPVGLALDALVVRLAVARDTDEDGSDGPEIDEATAGPLVAVMHPPPSLSLHAEVGSLVVAASPTQVWVRRLIIVGLTSGLFAATATRYDEVSHLAVVTAYICVFVICAGTDALSFRVPNVVTYPAIIGAIVVGVVMPGADIWEVLAGGGLAGAVLLLPALLTGGVGLGMGDVKLVTFAGLALGFENVVPALVLMALGGGLIAVVLLLSGRRRRGEPIPYAPFVSAGALAALLTQGAAFERFI